MRTTSSSLAILAVALLASGCAKARSAAESGPGGCVLCHGGVFDQSGAPPTDVHGNTTSVAVGAHQAHLTDGPITNAVLCTECHLVPTDTLHSGFGPTLAWGNLARANGVTPYPPPGPVVGTEAVTCANYCHGATLKGGTLNGLTAVTRIAWDAATIDCLTCHGFPPSTTPANGHNYRAFHSAYHCNECHATTMAAGTTDAIGNKALHLNGAVDFSRNAGAYTNQVIIRTDLGAAGIDYSCNVSCHNTGAGGTHSWTGW